MISHFNISPSELGSRDLQRINRCNLEGFQGRDISTRIELRLRLRANRLYEEEEEKNERIIFQIQGRRRRKKTTMVGGDDAPVRRPGAAVGGSLAVRAERAGRQPRKKIRRGEERLGLGHKGEAFDVD